MKVLKFGGSSVANAERIKLVKKIVESNAKDDKQIIVVSAFSGVTDLLLEAAEQAALRNEGYTQIMEEIEKRHLDTARELLPVSSQSKILSAVKRELNTLETL